MQQSLRCQLIQGPKKMPFSPAQETQAAFPIADLLWVGLPRKFCACSVLAEPQTARFRCAPAFLPIWGPGRWFC